MSYQDIIEQAYNDVAYVNQSSILLLNTIENIIDELDSGVIRVSEKINGQWIVHQWIKKAILLHIKLSKNKIICADQLKFYDKLALKYDNYTQADFDHDMLRAVPGAVVRKGAYIGKNVVLMPSFVNIGAYVGDGTMIDTWATVGSAAQIGKNVHISGGVGIGGVLEPLQSTPTIIEDNCFIGARSEVVEGVVVGEGSVLGMGVFLAKSTKIYNKMTKEISYGYIPPYSVVVSGSIPNETKDYNTYCAVIVKQVDAQTREKTAINELLR